MGRKLIAAYPVFKLAIMSCNQFLQEASAEWSLQGLGKGGMIAVGLSLDAGQDYLDRLTKGRVVIACYNSPTSITASGDYDAIEELEELLKADNVFARRLRIDYAYHSHHMKAIATPYYAWLNRVMKP
ncbi:hypothetical protein D6C89_07604 [Aureobasidium pullulans]|nr:hypothetical protein D6C89_07604 [Aureobasidium pullulans]